MACFTELTSSNLSPDPGSEDSFDQGLQSEVQEGQTSNLCAPPAGPEILIATTPRQ